jgi:hypothetical protein
LVFRECVDMHSNWRWHVVIKLDNGRIFQLWGAEEDSESGAKIAKGEASLLIILGSKDGVIFWCDAGAARSLVKLFLLDDSPLLMKFFLSIDHQQQA